MGIFRKGKPMGGSDIDTQLIQITSGPHFATIADVIGLMHKIDSVLPTADGLKWFNLLYMLVTQKVEIGPPQQGWHDSAWLTRLDVVFAQFYVAAISNWLTSPAVVPSSWKALFEARFRPGIERIQSALAGMNAHINHDLALALLQTDAELNVVPGTTSPEHDDFEHVNGILEAVLPQALEFLATGIVGDLAQDTGKIGRFLAVWDVRAARDLAWEYAGHLRSRAVRP
jgi:hypothetical protein